MTYIVLARKYRPKTFADMVGQEHVVQILRNAFQKQRLHHAFVLTGGRGVGKTTTARLLAAALTCKMRQSLEPCGQCSSCQQVYTGQHSDVVEIDGASHTGVEHMREICDSVRYLPSQGPYKLYIIDEVHMLSQAAFNALLKTLEEPPPHIKFIFATTEPQKIPLTVLSRCQRFDFRQVSDNVLKKHLQAILEKESLTLADSVLSAIVYSSQGSVRDALSLLEQACNFSSNQEEDGLNDDKALLTALGLGDKHHAFALLQLFLDKNNQALLQAIADLEKNNIDFYRIVQHLAHFIRALALLQSIPTIDAEALQCSKQECLWLQQQATKRSPGDWQRLFQQILLLMDEVSRSLLPRLSFEMGLLRLQFVYPSSDITKVMQALQQLWQHQNQVPALPTPTSSEAPEPLQSVAPSLTASVIHNNTTPGDENDLHDNWLSFVKEMRLFKPALASVLEHGQIIQFTSRCLDLAYSTGSFYYESALATENRSLILSRLQQKYGEHIQLKIRQRSAEDMGPTLVQSKQAQQRKHIQTIQDQAMEDANVLQAVKILGGKIQEIKVLDTTSVGAS